MSTKTLNVTWDDHLQNLSGLFQDLYENKKLCDVTLYCSGGTLLKAHKIVLSACSPYFSKIFQEIDIKHPVIILKGVTYDEMHQLLEFMYKGSINILEQDLACLIQAGSYLEIKGMNAKNIPNNIKTGLKRTCDDITTDDNQQEVVATAAASQSPSAKKLKDINHEVAKLTEHVSRESSPASASGASRRETRFKGQKRVDVKFRSSLGSASPVTTSASLSGANKKKDAEDEAAETTKGKMTKKIKTNKINKSQPDKKPVTTIQQEPTKNEENGSVSNLVIKDVYSTGDRTTEKLDENEDDDEIYSELEDENLVFPDVSFREADGEIVTQSDDEAIQNTDASEHLNVSYMECSYCSMTFKNDNDLFCHQKVHTEKKPFKCDFCDTFFQRSSHLARHRRKHIGDRPYECNTCGKAFSRSDKLRTHCRQAHDDDYKPPPHLKKKYEFVEFTGDMLEKKGRGRPRKFPMRDPPRPLLDGQKRGRGRPRKMSCPAPGEPVENYDITNLPFGDFSYLTEAIAMQPQEPETTYHDISIIPVSTSLNTSAQQQTPPNINTININANANTNTPQPPPTTTTTTTISSTTMTSTNENKNKNTEEENQSIIKSNELISNIRQIGECTIQPVAK